MDEQRPISDSSPAWPRRASRACANCRRDKIRCDGARPCAGCIKKGFSADQCVDGCDPCRRARVRCEDGKPCQRCRDMQLECMEETVYHAPRSESPTLAAARPMRANGSERAKLACTNCRRDNKKCDDQRPCGRCVSRNEECVHVSRGPKLVKLRCEGCRKDGKRCEDVRPCSNCVESGQPCSTQPRKGRGHGTRVKAACVSCRRDKIRCDGVRPCASCVRKGLECVERACKDCSREGRAAECTHRKAQAAAMAEAAAEAQNNRSDEYRPPSADNEYSSQPPPQQRLHLPPISHPSSYPPPPPPHVMYPPSHMNHLGPASHYYYPQQGMIGPGQPPQPIMQPYIQHPQSDQRVAYYPAIDPNIDKDLPTSGLSSFSNNLNNGHVQSADPSASTSR